MAKMTRAIFGADPLFMVVNSTLTAAGMVPLAVLLDQPVLKMMLIGVCWSLLLNALAAHLKDKRYLK